jgi:hypothetical protein
MKKLLLLLCLYCCDFTSYSQTANSKNNPQDKIEIIHRHRPNGLREFLEGADSVPDCTLGNQDVILKVAINGANFEVTFFDAESDYDITTCTIPISYGSKIRTRDSGWWSFSLLTIPFKIRPAIQDKQQIVKTDIKNMGSLLVHI